MSEISNVIVFGPTGQTGLQVLRRAIAEGLQVTAYVRRPQKIPADINGKLHRVLQGNVTDRKRVEDAIEGHDAVISALGTGWSMGPTTVISEGCQNIISGMKKYNVRKLVVVGDALLLPKTPRWLSGLFMFLWYIHVDHQRQLDILERETGSVDWIVVMPPLIKNNKIVNPNYKVEKNDLENYTSVTTGELADFMVKVCVDPAMAMTYRHCKVGVSSPSNGGGWWKTAVVLSLTVAVGAVLYKNWQTK